MSDRISILGVPVDAVTDDDALIRIEDLMAAKTPVYITTPNPEMAVEASRNPDFLKIMKGAALAIPDGAGLLWASVYLRERRPDFFLFRWIYTFGSLFHFALRPQDFHAVLPARVTGTDFFQHVADRAQKTGWKLFLLGAADGVADMVAAQLQRRFPGVKIAGTYAGSPDASRAAAICERINRSGADILFVAYGSPAQELWISANLRRLKTVRVAMGVGGAFDFVARKVPRAPARLRRTGLEWLWRLFCEPRRLKRIYRATVVFPRLCMRERLLLRPKRVIIQSLNKN